MMQFITCRLSSSQLRSPNVGYSVQKAILLPSTLLHLTGHDFKYEHIVVLSNILFKRNFAISRIFFKNKEDQNEGKIDIK